MPTMTKPTLLVLGTWIAVAGVAAAQQPAPAVRTAGQANRDIRVMKDVPATQVLPTMRVIAASLGVECEFCHRPNRADNTEKKDVARRMMTMVIALNQGSFGGQAKVTCYTCHRGSSNPLTAPIPTGRYTADGVGVLLKGNGNPIPGGNDQALSARYAEHLAAQAAELPTPDRLLAKYVDALGGETALRSVTARRITASMELPPDVRGVAPTLHALAQTYWKAPNQWVTTLQTANGATARGFDGGVAWAQDIKGVVTETTGAIPAPPLARVKRNADFYEALNLKQAYSQLTTRGIVRVRDREAYLVVGVPAGDLPEQLYFDKETGLLLRKGTATPTAFGDYAVQTDYDDYREVGGVKIPYVVRTIGVSPADNTTTYVEKIEINPTVDAARFAKPASR
jgi:hypothetical protein